VSESRDADAPTLDASETRDAAHELLTQTSAPMAARPRERSGELAKLERIGRHLVIEQLGAGGMGVVVAAYDPELDRKLAIKVIRFAERSGERGSQRMLREAQALAKLSHPNVIAVYDVGTIDAQLYIAMEFVAGRTLTRWLDDRRDLPLDWRATLEPFVQAGRGLAAAHAAGLVHRDFKPDNVLVGDDGRVRVVDFGLARAHERSDELAPPPPTRPSGATSSLLDHRMTEFGSLLGTPAYMPPERIFGQLDDARGDQYAFTVALWEGLYGQRPYHGSTLAALFEAVLEAKPNEPSPIRRALVPDWLHAVLLRALARAPEQRFASMQALLDALDGPRTSTRPRNAALLGLGLTTLALVGGLVLADARAPSSDAPPPCSGFEARLDGIWDAERRASLHDAMLASERSYASTSADLLARELDGWTQRWVDTRSDACEATALRHEQSPELLDLRMACLDRRLSELDALIGAATRSAATIVDEVPRLVTTLPALEPCSDPEQLGRVPRRPRDAALAERVDALEVELDTIDADIQTGASGPALARLEQLRDTITTLDWTPLRARHARLLAVALAAQTRRSDAMAAATEALALARRLDDDLAATRATIDLIHIGEHEVAFGPEAERLASVTRAELARLDAPLLEAELELAIGTSRFDRADHEGALAAYQRALALREAELGPDAWQVAEARHKLGDLLWPRGRLAEARTIYDEAKAIYAARLGPDHPLLSEIDGDLGALEWVSGDYERALEHFESSLARCLRSRPAIACTIPHGNVGATLAMQGELAGARREFETAVALLRTSPDLIGGLPSALDNLGDLELLDRRPAIARTHFEEARDIRLRILGEQHPDYARSLLAIAELDLDQGDAAAAREPLERALALREGFDAHVILRARIHRALARTYAALGHPPDQVRTQLDAAARDYEASKIAQADELEQLARLRAELLGD
jgi:serine/threonine protein kinase